jgi:dissimilatory sulfite reductase (desulfoviridin) alpha/beta subunit
VRLDEMYDDGHWKALIATIIDRVGLEKFLELMGEVVEDDIQKIITEHMKNVEVKGEA